ncbi:MAG TPA: PLP-dependent transferase, partial [Woeseiaceae bacterium]|nr:PLP-dependent transferase [Woeseiaceae bacterium]
PFDSYLTLRGVRTLHTRMRQHEESAHKIAAALERHPGVARVHYPGLPGHPQHELAKKQQLGFGGMLSFEIAGGLEAVREFVESLKQFSLAESLGGIESLVCHPATMTHAAVRADVLADAGVGENLVRLSVGLEDGDDLLADILAALECARLAGGNTRLAAVGS